MRHKPVKILQEAPFFLPENAFCGAWVETTWQPQGSLPETVPSDRRQVRSKPSLPCLMWNGVFVACGSASHLNAVLWLTLDRHSDVKPWFSCHAASGTKSLVCCVFPVTSLHKIDRVESISKLCPANRQSISRNTTPPQSWNLIQIESLAYLSIELITSSWVDVTWPTKFVELKRAVDRQQRKFSKTVSCPWCFCLIHFCRSSDVFA